MKRVFHPILFALYPVLALYSLNTSLVPAADVPVPLAISLLATLVFWGLMSLLLRSIARGAMGASITILLLFGYGHIWNLYSAATGIHRDFEAQFDLLWLWLIFWLVVFTLACWKWKKSEQITQAFNMGGIVLILFPILSISASWFSAWRGVAFQSVRSVSAKLNTSNRPDIFYIILDGYGRTDALQRVIGFSNAWFIQGLKDRGFFLPTNTHSNYCETELSLASSLNLDYLPKLFPEMNPGWKDRQVLDKVIDKNEVSLYLKRLGYRYEAITTGFPAVHPGSSDLWLRNDTGISLFEGVLLAETPIPVRDPVNSMSQFDARRLMLKGAFDLLGRNAPRVTQPRFFFVHILAPHPPFVFDANGGPIRPKHMGYSIVDGDHYYQNGGTPEEYATGYAGQATYISKLMLATVDKILKANKTPPVIIIQGDHGSKMKLDQELVEKTDLNECFPNLNAFFVPLAVRQKLYDGLTPVNSFRLLFDGLFGDTFPQLPDHSYYSGWSTPFRFVDVTQKIIHVPVYQAGTQPPSATATPGLKHD